MGCSEETEGEAEVEKSEEVVQTENEAEAEAEVNKIKEEKVEVVSAQEINIAHQEQLAKDFEMDMENFNALVNQNQDSFSPIISAINGEGNVDEASMPSLINNLEESLTFINNMQDYSQSEKYQGTYILIIKSSTDLALAYSSLFSFHESNYSSENLFFEGLNSYNQSFEKFKEAGSMYAQEKQQQL